MVEVRPMEDVHMDDKEKEEEGESPAAPTTYTGAAVPQGRCELTSTEPSGPSRIERRCRSSRSCSP